MAIVKRKAARKAPRKTASKAIRKTAKKAARKTARKTTSKGKRKDVYFFGGGKADGDATRRALLGGKGGA